jgi:hypothetical protein
VNDDELTQLVLVPPPGRGDPVHRSGSLAQRAIPIGAPSVGSRHAGETFFGDTYVGGEEIVPLQLDVDQRSSKKAHPSPPGAGSARPKAKRAHALGVRRAVTFAALAGIALALGLSWGADQKPALAPAGSSASEEPQPKAPLKGASAAPRPPVAVAPLVQVFPFEMSEQEATWAEQAHAAAQGGDCLRALELYQRLVNLNAPTRESGVLGMSRWVPFLEQVRRRCIAEREQRSTGAL